MNLKNLIQQNYQKIKLESLQNCIYYKHIWHNIWKCFLRKFLAIPAIDFSKENKEY